MFYIPNNGLIRHKPREPAEYVTVPCMDIGHRSLVVAKAWVRRKSTSHPKVNLDMSGDFRFRTFANPQAKTWFSDAIEATVAFWANFILPYYPPKSYSLLLYKDFICLVTI